MDHLATGPTVSSIPKEVFTRKRNTPEHLSVLRRTAVAACRVQWPLVSIPLGMKTGSRVVIIPIMLYNKGKKICYNRGR
jgi:hypothetical protein